MRSSSRTEQGAVAPVALMVLVAALIVIGALVPLVGATGRSIARATDKAKDETDLQRVLAEVVQLLAADPTPESSSLFDPVFSHRPEEGISVRVSDVGSRINPNLVQRAFLERSSVGWLMDHPDGPEGLQAERVESWYWPGEDERLSTMTEESSWDRLLGLYGYANLNTTGEFSLRELYAEHTGDRQAAEAFHDRITEVLREGRMVRPEEVPAFLSPYYTDLYPLMNVLPIFNVNLVAPELLEAVVIYPYHEVVDGKAAAAAILESRKTRELSDRDVHAIVVADEESRAYQYLGSITWFWEIAVENPRRSLSAIVARIPGIDRENDTYRVIALSMDTVDEDV